MAADRANRLWQEVRRALGRLASRTTVREVTAQQRAFDIDIKRSGALDPLTADPGRRENDWAPKADTILWTLPDALPGGGNTDLANVATVVSADNALPEGAAAVQCPPWRVEGGAAHNWNLNTTLLAPPPIEAPPVRFAAATVRAAPAQTVPPRLHALAVQPVTLARRKRMPSEMTWPLRPPRQAGALALMARVPMTRQSLAPPPGLTVAEAFAAERYHLAAANATDEADVLLVGLFPQVPLALVQKLNVVADGGLRLQIWLKPAALTSARKDTTLATIILGRQRSTGRVLQTVAKPGVR